MEMDTLENAQRRAEYWKAEHSAANAEIERLRELCREAYHELNCCDEGDVFDRTHSCCRCDSSIDRNGLLRGKLALAFVMMPNAI